VLAAYRRTGADLPFGDPRGHHGTNFEGYFWRITHAASRTVIVVLAGVNRDASGSTWGTLGLAAHPGGFVRDAAVARAHASRHGLHIGGRGAPHGAELRVTGDRLALVLGRDTRVDIALTEHAHWPRRVFGGIGPAQMLPGLSQYWHPHLLTAGVTGSARIDGREIDLDGATAYAEKNWGPGGFPDAWWWGQAHGFDDVGACVAFAGGHATVGPFGTIATALAVRAGDELVHFVRPLTPIGVQVGADGWRLRARGPRHRVEIEAHPNGTAPHLLPVPLPAARRHLPDAAAQHLAGHLRLTIHRGRRLRYRGETTLAGLERGSTYGDSGLPVRAGRRERQRFRADQPLERRDREPEGAQA
jgi:hypothetical protein